MKSKLVIVLMFQFSFLASSPPLKGDEGMYLFNDLPRRMLQKRYGFNPTEAWADHLRLSSVRFNSGGSGSFISSNGLVLTNHHVASDTLHKLSTPERNLIDDGYLAKSLAQATPFCWMLKGRHRMIYPTPASTRAMRSTP